MLASLAGLAGLSPLDIDLLHRVEAGLLLLADLSRADVLLYCRGQQSNTAMVVAHAQPNPVASVFPENLAGQTVGKKSEPAIFQVFARGRSSRVFNGEPQRGSPTVQEVFPIRAGGDTVIAVLNIEANLLEYERMSKKSPVFRKALSRIQQMVMQGQLASAANIGRLGERDGSLVVDSNGTVQYISGIAENLFRKLGHVGSLLSIHLSEIETGEGLTDQAFAQGCCLQKEVGEEGLIWIKKVVPIFADAVTWVPGRGAIPPGNVTAVMLIIEDVTEERTREHALRVKSAMIQEIHHRVKNNLQTIAALLRMQARRAENDEVADLLQGSVNRILSVAVVHEFLSHDEDAIINIREVCGRIISEVTHGILDPDKQITIRLEGENVYLPAQQSTSTALVVNELLQNSVKHGYAGRNEGTIVVRLSQSESEIEIEIADDGNGLPPGFSLQPGGHLGLQIIRTLVEEDLRGSFSLTSDHGVTAKVTLPRLSAKQRGWARV